MKANSLSYEFQFIMLFVATFFWILNWIPVLNVISNAIYWCIWLGVFILKYRPLITSIIKNGVGVGMIYLKISIIFGVAFILGEIPFISIVPWDIIANVWINQLIKQLLAKVEQIQKDAAALKRGWQKHWQQHSLRSRGENYATISSKDVST